MAVEREEPEAVVQDDGVAIDSQVARENHRAGVRRLGRIALGDREVVAEVVRLVDRFALVGVGALVGEVRFHLGVRELDKGAVPLSCGGGLLRDRRDPVVVLLPRVVDCEERLLRAALLGVAAAEKRATLLSMKLSETAMVLFRYFTFFSS